MFLACQVVLNNAKRAESIETERFGQKFSFKATKEIIVSAGAIGSPQILLLSGIGPKDQLKSVGVDIKHNLPGVGENLQDHVMTSLWLVSENSDQLGINPFDLVNPLKYLKYFIWGKGPLVSNGIETGAFIRTNVSKDPWNRPDIQFQTLSATLAVDFGLSYREAFNLAEEFFTGAYGSINGM